MIESKKDTFKRGRRHRQAPEIFFWGIAGKIMGDFCTYKWGYTLWDEK